jgi:methylenetetrahydrofolate dehydrogenase (NADP+)/methenyltetrahydrofolate cyclohydrolase
MPDNASEAQVLTEIRKLSQDQEVDGILLQLPLPNHLHRDNIVRTIPANKDVDGLVPENQGLLCWGHPGLRPCTPLGIVELIKSTGIEISGKRAVVVGRSILVGLPVAQLLIHENATVTVVHSKSKNPESLAREADILVVAAGKPLLVDDSWIKRGAIVIDVGIHRVDGKIVGDVNFASAERVAGYLTPVPGGVGPMTIAMLLVNCLRAYEDRRQS